MNVFITRRIGISRKLNNEICNLFMGASSATGWSASMDVPRKYHSYAIHSIICRAFISDRKHHRPESDSQKLSGGRFKFFNNWHVFVCRKNFPRRPSIDWALNNIALFHEQSFIAQAAFWSLLWNCFTSTPMSFKAFEIFVALRSDTLHVTLASLSTACHPAGVDKSFSGCQSI